VVFVRSWRISSVLMMGSYAFLFAKLAWSQTTVPTNPGCVSPAGAVSRLCRNNYVLDLYQGPLLAPTRVMGLGGAYVALAEGVDGIGQNAAASVVRPAYSTGWFDNDVTLGVTLTGAFGRTDFDNSGTDQRNTSTFFYTLGGLLQFGNFGVGVLADFQRYSVDPRTPSDARSATTIGRLHATAGYNFWDGQLSVAGGVRGLSMAVNSQSITQETSQNALTLVGVAPQIGAVLRPNFASWRVGVGYRPAVEAEGIAATAKSDGYGVRRAADLAVPTAARAPWELEIGVALSAGPRPLNPRWIPPREHEAGLEQQIQAARTARERAYQLELARLENPTDRSRLRAQQERDERDARADEKVWRAHQQKLLEAERSARYENWPRDRILFVGEVLMTGATEGGIGLRSFLVQEDVPGGRRVSLQPRLGLEGEPILGVLVTRVGTYLEPTRYDSKSSASIVGASRQHFTVGLDVRVFEWSAFGLFRPHKQWRVSFVGDLAPRYQNFGLSVGTWRLRVCALRSDPVGKGCSLR